MVIANGLHSRRSNCKTKRGLKGDDDDDKRRESFTFTWKVFIFTAKVKKKREEGNSCLVNDIGLLLATYFSSPSWMCEINNVENSSIKYVIFLPLVSGI